ETRLRCATGPGDMGSKGRPMGDCAAQPVRAKARWTAGSTRIVILLWEMVLAPQRIPNNPSSTLSIGRWRTVFCGTCTCSRKGAKKQCRRKYSPKAQRLARPVVIVVCLYMVHSCH